jgi:GntR family transcriptional repressor for pyruvate dehydrogenase complex
VREAISNLRAIGMVATRQGVGAFVVRTSANTPFYIEEATLDVLQEVVGVLEVRIALEVEAANLAAQRRATSDLKVMKGSLRALSRAVASEDDGVRADLDFHGAIAKATGNKHFLSLFGYLGALLIPRSRVRTFDAHPSSRHEYLDRILREHTAIYEAIEAKDADSARAAMAAHLGRSKNRLQRSSELLTTSGRKLRITT